MRLVIFYTATILAGILTVLGFAPFHYPFLSLVGLAILFTSWLYASPKQAFYMGYGFGLGFFSFGVSWIYESIHGFGDAIAPLAFFIALLFINLLALFPALTGFFAKFFFKKVAPVTQLVLIFPVVWTLSEWGRGWFLTGFPWLNIGNSLIDTPFAHIAPVLGGYGVTWFAALTISLLLSIFFVIKWRYLFISLASLVIIITIISLLKMADWTVPKENQSLQVAMIQGNVSQDTQWQPGQLENAIETYKTLTNEHWHNDLIIWPETAIFTFAHEIYDSLLAPLQNEARIRNTDLLIGIFDYDYLHQRYYNAMLALGKTPGIYRKHHLVPFGEYLPLRELLKFLERYIQIPMADISSGDAEQDLLVLAEQEVGVTICYESAFSNEFTNKLPAAAFLINASNDAWFGDSLAPHQHLEIARMRALEVGRYLLRATNNGISAVIDPKGKILDSTPQFETAVLTTTIYPYQGMTPFARWGNYALLVLLILTLVLTTGLSLFIHQKIKQ